MEPIETDLFGIRTSYQLGSKNIIVLLRSQFSTDFKKNMVDLFLSNVARKKDSAINIK
jgi:hypothetical protein